MTPTHDVTIDETAESGRSFNRFQENWANQLAQKPWRLFLAIFVVAVLVQSLQQTVLTSVLPETSGVVQLLAVTIWLPLLLGFLSWRLVLKPLIAVHDRSLRRVAGREKLLAEEASRLDFDSQLHVALEMAETETDVVEVVGRALRMAAPQERSHFMLVADELDGRLQHVAVSAPEGSPAGCGVTGPRECPAIRKGSSLVFPDSEALDACPRLRDRDTRVHAACTPVSVLGKPLGVIHAVRGHDAEGGAPSRTAPNARMQLVAQRAGSRLGLVRLLAEVTEQATTDPLTGLANRRRLIDRFGELGPGTHALAICDLDHFKQLNDEFGHEVGDAALSLFASVMREHTRPEDLAARLGGEEFALLLPDCDAEGATVVLERVRAGLAGALKRTSSPVFTVSVGVSDTATSAPELDILMRAADDALYAAKRGGRDRVVLGASEPR